MKKPILLLTILVLACSHEALGQTTRNVVINKQRLDTETIQALERLYQVRVQDGAYWYDPMCGVWGFEGGPGVSFIHPGLNLGGPLRADASRGDTNVFVNGRELHRQDVLALQQLVGFVNPGRYWLDAYGTVGYEGGPAILNLVMLARQTGGGQGNTFYRSGNTDIGAGSSGGTSYVMGKDWSVIVGN
jgi:hypothetical protein